MLILSLGHSKVKKVLPTELLFWLDTLSQFVQVVKLTNSTMNKPKTLGQCSLFSEIQMKKSLQSCCPNLCILVGSRRRLFS